MGYYRFEIKQIFIQDIVPKEREIEYLKHFCTINKQAEIYLNVCLCTACFQFNFFFNFFV